MSCTQIKSSCAPVAHPSASRALLPVPPSPARLRAPHSAVVCCHCPLQTVDFFPQMPGILLFCQKFFSIDQYSLFQLLAVCLHLERRAVNKHRQGPVDFGKVQANRADDTACRGDLCRNRQIIRWLKQPKRGKALCVLH